MIIIFYSELNAILILTYFWENIICLYCLLLVIYNLKHFWHPFIHLPDRGLNSYSSFLYAYMLSAFVSKFNVAYIPSWSYYKIVLQTGWSSSVKNKVNIIIQIMILDLIERIYISYSIGTMCVVKIQCAGNYLLLCNLCIWIASFKININSTSVYFCSVCLLLNGCKFCKT